MTRKAIRIMFVLYLIFLIWAIIWKCQLPVYIDSEQLRIGETGRMLNLIPFRDNAGYEKYINFLLFVPLGFYLSVIFERLDTLKRLSIVAATSLVFEAIQFAFSIGRSDITDLILNTVGGLTGIGIFALLTKQLGKQRDKFVLIAGAFITTVVLYFSVSFIAIGYVHIGRLIFR